MSTSVHERGKGVENRHNIVHVVIEWPLNIKNHLLSYHFIKIVTFSYKNTILKGVNRSLKLHNFEIHFRLVLHWLEGKQLADESVKSNDSAVMMIECLEMRG